MARTRRWAGMVVAVWVMGTLLAGAQAPDRLSDLDVKRLIADLAKSRDAFEAQLDDSAKNAVITGPRGDVRVREYLDQFKQSVDNVKNRFTEQYSANSEAQTVLRQGTDIQKFLASRPAGPAAAAWESVAGSLKQLAVAYRVVFPLSSTSVTRRINDGSVELAAETLANEAKRLSDTISREVGYSKEDRETLKTNLDTVSKESKQIRKNASQSKTAGAEAQRMLDAAVAVTKYFQEHPPSPTVASQWTVVRDPVERIVGAYGIPMPSFVKK
jgi:hypothetical protein